MYKRINRDNPEVWGIAFTTSEDDEPNSIWYEDVGERDVEFDKILETGEVVRGSLATKVSRVMKIRSSDFYQRVE